MIRPDLKDFISTIPNNVTLVAATKYIDADTMRELFSYGVRDFGENRVDSFINKHFLLRDLPITWHFIGHLQTNKAKEIINDIDYLHSLDSLKLASLIEKYRKEPLPCFIEVSINKEDNKNGVYPEKLYDFLTELKKYPKVQVKGLMMMTIADSSLKEKQEQFHQLFLLKERTENELNISIPFLSMGMSDDYPLALIEGATHIRLGRILFKK